MTDDQLKPCPFCGEVPVVVGTTSDGPAMVQCGSGACAMREQLVYVGKWNRRAPVEYLRCETCEHWERLTGCFNGRCYGPDGPGNIVGARFGCVHHAPREVTGD
jgi:hypothetical protein